MKKIAEQNQKKYSGVLDGWFETGSEGVCWVLDTKRKNIGYDGLVFIEPGDHLKVYAEDNSVIFDGAVVADTKTGWRRFPKNRKYGQQCALGVWIHWIQKGWKPDDWAKLFIKHRFKEWEGSKPLHAELIQKKKKAQ